VPDPTPGQLHARCVATSAALDAAREQMVMTKDLAGASAYCQARANARAARAQLRTLAPLRLVHG
jgi:hypothetical protein